MDCTDMKWTEWITWSGTKGLHGIHGMQRMNGMDWRGMEWSGMKRYVYERNGMTWRRLEWDEMEENRIKMKMKLTWSQQEHEDVHEIAIDRKIFKMKDGRLTSLLCFVQTEPPLPWGTCSLCSWLLLGAASCLGYFFSGPLLPWAAPSHFQLPLLQSFCHPSPAAMATRLRLPIPSIPHTTRAAPCSRTASLAALQIS